MLFSIGLIGGYFAFKMKCNRADVYQAAIGGCLADCGMAKLPPRLLNKRESLTADDYKEIHAHPIFSYKMIKDSSIIKDSVKVAVLEHHGRLDRRNTIMFKEKIHFLNLSFFFLIRGKVIVFEIYEWIYIIYFKITIAFIPDTRYNN